MAKYFKPEELACKCGCKLSDPDERLMETLDTIREAAGESIRVTSGRRCTLHNAKVGGVKSKTTIPRKGEPGGEGDSNHTHGTAADIQTKTMNALALHGLILKLHQAGGLPHLAGLGLYNTFVHVDVAPKKPGRLRRWDERTG